MLTKCFNCVYCVILTFIIETFDDILYGSISYPLNFGLENEMGEGGGLGVNINKLRVINNNITMCLIVCRRQMNKSNLSVIISGTYNFFIFLLFFAVFPSYSKCKFRFE